MMRFQWWHVPWMLGTLAVLLAVGFIGAEVLRASPATECREFLAAGDRALKRAEQTRVAPWTTAAAVLAQAEYQRYDICMRFGR